MGDVREVRVRLVLTFCRTKLQQKSVNHQKSMRDKLILKYSFAMA